MTMIDQREVAVLKKGDYVEAYYNGSRYTGVLGDINEKWMFATVRMSPGVEMILPLSTMTVIKEEEFDELDSYREEAR